MLVRISGKYWVILTMRMIMSGCIQGDPLISVSESSTATCNFYILTVSMAIKRVAWLGVSTVLPVLITLGS